MKIKYSLLVFLCIVILSGCSKETITPETFGSIDGQVFDSETEEGISSVNITTSPATNSITTNQDGNFNLSEIPTNQYTVTASKSGYESKSVNVNVRENKTATAQIYLDSEGSNSGKYLEAEVTAWAETTSNDSTFAEVEYEVKNTSDDSDINAYEIYFDVHTSGDTFSKEEGDTALAAGERNIGEFRKYVRQNTIDSVVVNDTYASD